MKKETGEESRRNPFLNDKILSQFPLQIFYCNEIIYRVIRYIKIFKILQIL